MRNKFLFGFTLLEFLVAITVISIMVTIGIPSFLDMISKYHLKGATETVYSDLQLARMEAIKRNKNISLSFQTSNTDKWCYAMHDGNICDCNVSSHCKMNDKTTMVTLGQQFNDVNLKTNFQLNSISFSPIRGTSNSGSITLTTNQKSSKLIVSSRGRIRACSDDLMDYPAC